MNEQRAALLHQVQYALDGAGIGRKEIKHAHQHYGERWVQLGKYRPRHFRFKGLSLDVMEQYFDEPPKDLPVWDFEPTFTFAELFPELEWESHGEVSESKVDEYVRFVIPDDEPYMLVINDSVAMVALPLGTPDLAKETAQFIADQLAKADRARKEAGK